MKLAEYLKPRGRQAQLAKEIGAHQPDIQRWADGTRPVPIRWCYAIEVATSGQVTREELRPNDWHLIWPELSELAKEA